MVNSVKGHFYPIVWVKSSWYFQATTSETASVSEPDDELKGVTLDKFLAAHTSEDNESFNDLQEEQQKELERTHPWLFTNAEQLSIENKKAQLVLPSIEEQCANLSSKAIEYSKPLGVYQFYLIRVTLCISIFCLS